MATIKSFTSLEQSKMLAEILPIDSADNVIVSIGDREGVKIITMPKETLNILRTPFTDIRNATPCWSLAALLEQLDEEITDNNGNDYTLTILKEALQYQLYYHDSLGRAEGIETYYYENMVDACYEMILRLHERKIL